MTLSTFLARSVGGIFLVLAFQLPGSGVSAESSSTPTTFSVDACLPIDMPAADKIFSSTRKIFAHYFNRLPLSIDNRPATDDYYTNEYLTPSGEHDKWLAEGGYLRSRPLPVDAPKPNYTIENLKHEIRLAMSRGIAGFTFDILSLDDISAGSYLPNMIEAAQAVDPRFQIVLMPDMSALHGDTHAVLEIVRALYTRPSLYRSPNGTLVVAPFLSESVSASAWNAMKRQLDDEGLPITLIPTFLSLQQTYIDSYRAVSDGFGTFGTPLPSQALFVSDEAARAHAAGKTYMAGISGQGYRPKNFLYWEANGSLAYRDGWTAAIASGADSIQLTTWNDFSESTAVSPITDREGTSGTGYFNLTGYYASWFLNGRPPVITHDVLYYFYRKQPVGAAAPLAGSQTVMVESSGPSADEIELVGYLTAPGTLSITIDDNTFTADVAAGVQSLRAPLSAGRPHFALTRNAASVIAFDGQTTIVGGEGLAAGYADLTYWSGSASAKGTCFSDSLAVNPVATPPPPRRNRKHAK